ncbi:ogr/Delta-like zinc finger family protein [candidate division KSB1 bacterium]
MSEKEKPKCPHCGSRLLKWETPPESTWGAEIMLVCFNDECPYFIKGWKWMEEKYQQKASYRYCINPVSGNEKPLPVWSPSALRNRVVEG